MNKFAILLSLFAKLFAQPLISSADSTTLTSSINFSIWDSRLRNMDSFKKMNKKLSISMKTIFYMNSNLPNTENMNGKYFPKGNGLFHSLIFEINNKYFSMSLMPTISQKKTYYKNYPKKSGMFSVLNDVQANNKEVLLQNSGFKLKYKGFDLGYGNWNYWWGPGIHNSLTLSNNSDGFNHIIVGTSENKKIINGVWFNMKYIVSSEMKNKIDAYFYYSALMFEIKSKVINFGISRNILSGGNPNIQWGFKDAFSSIINQKNNEYWDIYNNYYLLLDFYKDQLKIYGELAIPTRSYGDNNPANYWLHATGSNIGFRKKDILNNKYLLFGIEYTRLLQSSYYSQIPSQNWFDNYKFNYSSYNNRRWSAHSGSDSDDMYLFFGYDNNNVSIIYGINYERHGVTYKFPPEVKLESRLAVKYLSDILNISLYLENEYFEHYGFVDTNNNVWSETFEKGSLQRTNTIVLSIDYKIF